MIEPPEDVLARLDRDVESLRRRGFGPDADRMARVADEFRAALEPIALVSEAEAMMRTGRSRRWLQQHFAEWEFLHAAAERNGDRQYRLCVLPPRTDAEARGAADADAMLRAG